MILGIACICLTLLSYLAARALYNRRHYSLLSPVVLSPLVIIAALLFFHVPYPSYIKYNQWLVNMLGPATVAFAIPIYHNLELIKRNAIYLAASVVGGVTAAATSSFLLGTLFHQSPEVVLSLVPHSVTTPFAVQIAGNIGGQSALCAVFVIITGIVGGLLGPMLIKVFRVKNPVTRGAMLAVSAHGFGSLKALELGKQEGSVALLSMVICGIVSVFFLPVLLRLLELLHWT